MQFRLIGLLLIVWSTIAHAQEVEVRAGEHADFTRLVFNLPQRLQFELVRGDKSAELRLDAQTLVFKIDSVFERVPKTRLTALVASNETSSVRLSLNCNCEIRSFWHSQNALVLDITDTVAIPDARSVEPSVITPAFDTVVDVHGQQILGRSANALAPSMNTFEDSEEPESIATSEAVAPIGQPSSETTSGMTAAGLVSNALDRQFGSLNGTTALTESERLRLQESREQLVKELGRAATQGLLTPREAAPPVPGFLVSDQPQEPSVVVISDANQSTPPPQNLQLRAQNSVDRDLSAAIRTGLDPIDLSSCLPLTSVDVASWGSDKSFSHQIGKLRAQLVGELDEPNSLAALALAKLYIYFGFGAEARHTIFELTQSNAQTPILLSLAEIMENGFVDGTSQLASQMDCDPSVAFWSVMSYREIPINEPLNPDAVLRGFSALPKHLRAHLGPVLAQRLLAAGYRMESDKVRRVLKRSEETHTYAAALLDANEALAQDATDTAEESLGEIVAQNIEPSAEALLQLVTARLERDAVISYETAQLIGAFATEHRGQPMGTELTHAFLSALAVSSAFDEAFSEFQSIASGSNPSRIDLESALLDILADRASDAVFLKHALAPERTEPAAIEDQVANRIAERLINLGFLTAAQSFVIARASNLEEAKRKKLRAEIALQLKRPRQAELELLGLEGEDVSGLKARARSMAGDHQEAKMVFHYLGETDQATREAWLDTDWKDLVEHERSAISNLANILIADEEQTSQDAENELAQNRALVATSDQLRGAMTALLDEFPTLAEDPQ